MGDVVNLRLARKARRRTTAERDAEAKRQVHGRTKTERKMAESERAMAERVLDGHRRDQTR